MLVDRFSRSMSGTGPSSYDDPCSVVLYFFAWLCYASGLSTARIMSAFKIQPPGDISLTAASSDVYNTSETIYILIVLMALMFSYLFLVSIYLTTEQSLCTANTVNRVPNYVRT